MIDGTKPLGLFSTNSRTSQRSSRPRTFLMLECLRRFNKPPVSGDTGLNRCSVPSGRWWRNSRTVGSNNLSLCAVSIATGRCLDSSNTEWRLPRRAPSRKRRSPIVTLSVSPPRAVRVAPSALRFQWSHSRPA